MLITLIWSNRQKSLQGISACRSSLPPRGRHRAAAAPKAIEVGRLRATALARRRCAGRLPEPTLGCWCTTGEGRHTEATARRHHPRHGQLREPDPWPAGGLLPGGTATSAVPVTTRSSYSTSSATWSAYRSLLRAWAFCPNLHTPRSSSTFAGCELNRERLRLTQEPDGQQVTLLARIE